MNATTARSVTGASTRQRLGFAICPGSKPDLREGPVDAPNSAERVGRDEARKMPERKCPSRTNFVDRQGKVYRGRTPAAIWGSAFPELPRFAAFHCVGPEVSDLGLVCAYPLPRAHSFLGEDRCPRGLRQAIGPEPHPGLSPVALQGPSAALPEPPIAAPRLPRRCRRNVRRDGPPHW